MKLFLAIVACAVAIATPAAIPAVACAAAPDPAPVKLRSLRGDTPIDQTTESDVAKLERDLPTAARSSKLEPPLIPHSIRSYQITRNFNQCMDCHAWTKARETGATKVSVTHFRDAGGKELINISPRRYVCTSCHVTQADVPPLVGNTFQPAAELAPGK